MLRYFLRAFKITNENIILTTPLVLFLFLLSIYLGIAQNAPSNIQSSILLLATILFMISAFFSGWFYMVKKAIDLENTEFIMDEDKAKASFNLIKEIPSGIGEYFLPFLGAMALYGLVFLVLGFVAFKLGLKYIGDVGIGLEQMKTAFSSPVALKAAVASLSGEQLIKLNYWNMLIMVVVSGYSFLTMYWGPQIIYKTKNPVLSFLLAIKAIFKKPLSSIILFVYISFINTASSFLSTFATVNPILYFVSMLIYFYFIVYVVVLIFLYYDREINEKTEDNSGSGSDSIREDESGDSDSTED